MTSMWHAVLAAFILLVDIQAAEFPKYPYGLLTDSYGIVTEDDLAFDNSEVETTPYDPNKSLAPMYWQCFASFQVEAIYRSWPMDDDRGRPGTSCAPEFYVRINGELQIYADRRGHDLAYCKEVVWAWKKLTKDMPTVCLNGSGGFYNEEKGQGKYKLWTWEKFKTKRGCYSYFVGQCRTKGCARGKCKRS
ncbi:MAG: hypothetical protein AB1540_17935 [Bdellovibrionota bacterium]